MSKVKKGGIHTQVTHSGFNPDSEHGSVAPPIYQTSTFKFRSADHGARLFSGEDSGYIYTRLGNPTTEAFEQAVAELEHANGGLATASGMAAVSTVFMTFLGQGTHMVGTDAVYGPSRVVIEKDFSRFGVEFDFVDTSDLENVKQAMRPDTRLLYIETPANPTIKLTDIAACAEIAHENDCLLVVDNTFMSPVLQTPLDLGADISLHSITKFLNGHTDVVGGVITCQDELVYNQVSRVLRAMGGTMDPHQSWLVLRGLRTLAMRVERAQETAMTLAGYLENHPKISWVRYPGLESHPQHTLAGRQARGYGSMISFEVQGGIAAGKTLMDNVQVATLAVSLGGYETLIQHPASMTHASMGNRQREESGISDGLVRLSVGCEDLEDLQADLDRCLGLI